MIEHLDAQVAGFFKGSEHVDPNKGMRVILDGYTSWDWFDDYLETARWRFSPETNMVYLSSMPEYYGPYSGEKVARLECMTAFPLMLTVNGTEISEAPLSDKIGSILDYGGTGSLHGIGTIICEDGRVFSRSLVEEMQGMVDALTAPDEKELLENSFNAQLESERCWRILNYLAEEFGEGGFGKAYESLNTF